MAAETEIELDEECESIGVVQGEQMSPSFRKKLWMKTPFSSFSSDSTFSAADPKCKELRCLRDELKSSRVTFDLLSRDEKVARWKNAVCDREVSQRAYRRPTGITSLEGPLRVIRLCILSIVFPGVLVGVPLYMRYFVYGEQVYPIGMSDMRLLDSRVSTTWCQSQVVWSNATYNAYLMSNQPQVDAEHEHVSMTRHLKLEDDMKEYWGFYLLRGSVITVSTCSRWQGASLILIKGHKHLRECAYIGDDSSEELDELDEDDSNYTQVNQEPANKPAKMRKLMEGIVHHHKINASDKDAYAVHRRKIDHSTSESTSKDDKANKLLRTDYKMGHTVHLAYAEFGDKLAPYKKRFDIDMEKTRNSPQKNGYKKSPGSSKNLVQDNLDEKSAKPATSREIYEDILKRLEGLGDRGTSILERLNNKLSNKTEAKTESLNSTDSADPNLGSKIKIRHSKKLLKKHRLRKNETEDEELDKIIRLKRELIIGELQDALINHNEDEDTALEEEMHQPDDIADIRGTINETTSFDKSNSEFWSSFSSSEERLLNCEGLLLNLPLMPHRGCDAGLPESNLAAASSVNKITYRVAHNGYYFFVFNSENEVQTNFLRVHFHLEKTKYNVSNPVASCKNQTSACSLPLSFWSHQKVVLHLPVIKNDSLWNQEFLVVSTCEPRTTVYIVCVIAVPLFIMLFAFQ